MFGVKSIDNNKNIGKNYNAMVLNKANQISPSLKNKTDVSYYANRVNSNISFGKFLRVSYLAPDGVIKKPDIVKDVFVAARKKLASNTEYESWTNLPKQLLSGKYVDNVYETVKEFKKPFGKNTNLISVSLGNPANSDEVANALGLGAKVTYCCGTMPGEIKQAIAKAGGNLNKIQILISSKSGTTFESNETYKLLRKELTNHYKNKGVDSKVIDKEISKHFLCLTDKNPQSKLKAEAIKRGFKTIDCVDGLHSGFGDLAYDMPLLAYAGMPKQSMFRMLEAADKMSKNIIKNHFSRNIAAKMAAFDKYAVDNKATKEQFVFHTTMVNLPSTIKQLYEESLRKINFETHTYPRSAHSSLQASIDSKLPGQAVSNITNVTITGKPVKTSKLEAAHIKNAQDEGHYQKTIKLFQEDGAVKPEAMGEFLILKSFVAFFKNEFEGLGQNLFNQSYVKGYKEIFKDSL